ncbi:hypothetical protein PAQ31011_00658 [Pandoraea aquatica]|uniref:Uncharacterized protein n=1 Tax=Pandoraea aquatica TaxID=2508290 RepID=A0A5E4S9J2_9BURK|nr:hypothetical protein PAQ31011_00658 [Pandoraea aquatica]
MISDVLVTDDGWSSGKKPRYERTYIPSIGGTFPHVGPNAAISGMMQKTFLLPDGKCIAAAGGLQTVLSFRTQVEQAAGIDEVLDVCSRHVDELDFVFMSHCVEYQQLLVLATETCRRMTLDAYGAVIIGGSGESTIRRLVTEHAELPFSGEGGLATLGRALCLVNAALELDASVPQSTLGRRFGAYYEVTYFDGESFVKLDRTIHHFLAITLVEGLAAWFLSKSFYHEYVDGVLVARRITWGADEAKSFVWQDCYEIGGDAAPFPRGRFEEHINTVVPDPVIEVLNIKVGDRTFRFVSSQEKLVKIWQEDGRWFSDLDADMDKRLREIIAGRL